MRDNLNVHFVLALKLMLCWVTRGLLCNCRAISMATKSMNRLKRANSLSQKALAVIERLLKLFKAGLTQTISRVS
ncbi:hypothetical protein ABWH74_002098 [Burkholderia vietnamiensis]|jgi:hypothetical protein|uniref:hypothetical protein n=1 Tax=Burkholderia TaxID=32008 RepID=UPI0002EF114E|nr:MULTISPECIES: hypothetical protein [Burkholderia]MBE0631430.1 hypothetical protein [Burkholderia vietnamiensis]MBR7912748.1 hypothetical protein [Burkholderia vietnamiensis]MBR8000554.1 hypothetical protein [Burkholderia vietnamiensis]MBR8055424.1 hypothetical protein [Burkholderia vietnamiensis]MBR8216104.1 hypothetical protein [Burkholderia vietnamiensis]